MRQTLFYIPNELGPLPVFGWGWVLIAWLMIGTLIFVAAARKRGWRNELFGMLPMIGLVAVAIVLLLPRIEEPIPAGYATFPSVEASQGLPIRGYGVMLLLAVVAAVTWAVYRSQRAGLNPDLIIGLAFYLVVSGIIGARVFFVIQHWNLIQAEQWSETLVNMVSVVRGGLVVYGSLIGAAVGFLLFAWKHQLNALALGDLIAPSLALGLAIGRIGCLLNGCCFGGTCDADFAWAVRFPADSPPYVHQRGLGQLHGMRIEDDGSGNVLVAEIDMTGPMRDVDIAVGQRIESINGIKLQGVEHARSVLENSPAELMVTMTDGRQVNVWLNAWPERSLPVHPTQLYSSVNALLLALLVALVFPFRQRHGQVLALLLTLYAVTRFLLEIIRTDERAFMAQLTISQNISVLIAVAMLALWIYVFSGPKLKA